MISTETLRRLARQGERFHELANELPDFLDSSRLPSYLVGDTIVFEKYRRLSEAAVWLVPPHSDWLDVNVSLVQAARSSAMHRLFLLPQPAALRHPKCHALREFINLHLHLHLWHGVVCGIKFVDPRSNPGINVDDLHFVHTGTAGVYFDFPGWTGDRETARCRHEGVGVADREARLRSAMPGNELIWLWYDEENYTATRRLSSTRWAAVRDYFYELHDRAPLCRYCGAPASELDHVQSVKSGAAQTLPNFQWLCLGCNRRKGSATIDAGFRVPGIVDERLRSDFLTRVFREPPPWLGTVSRPANVRDIRRRVPYLG